MTQGGMVPGGGIIPLVPAFGHIHWKSMKPSGAFLAAIQAAGAGHHIVASNARTGEQDMARKWQASGRYIIGFDTGVSPRWWQSADVLSPISAYINPVPIFTAMTGIGTEDGVAAAGEYISPDDTNTLAVVSDDLTYYSDDEQTFSQKGDWPTGQINDVFKEMPKGVYIAAADDGVLKFFLNTEEWGSIRPHAGVGTTWPAGAIGRQVVAGEVVISPAEGPQLFLLGEAGDQFQAYNILTGVWDNKGAIPGFDEDDIEQIQYFGSGLMMYINADSELSVSADHGVTWTPKSNPPPGGRLLSFGMSPGNRLWAATFAGGNTNIFYSDNNGDDYILSDGPFATQGQTGFVACHPADARKIAVAFKSGGDLYVRKTLNGGTTWSDSSLIDVTADRYTTMYWVGNRLVVVCQSSD